MFGLWDLFKMDHFRKHISPASKWTHKSKTFLKNKRKQTAKNNKKLQRAASRR